MVFILTCNLFDAGIDNFADLQDRGLPGRIADALRFVAEQYDQDTPEEVIVTAFLFMLTRSPVGGEFDRKAKRAINKAMKVRQPDQRLINLMTVAFSDISEDDWGPQLPLEDEDD